MVITAQAEELNEIIQENNSTIFHLLSVKGKEIYFPRKGILSQAAEARASKINATIGVAIEDDGTPMRIPSIAEKILLDPKDVFLYASSYGKGELRESWKREIQKKNPSLKGKMSLPIVTNGVTNGLNQVGYLFVNPGDELILPDKFWGNYRLIFEKGFDAKLKTFNLFAGNGFDIDSFAEKIFEGNNKKIVLLNFPNNPTGYTPTNEEVRRIVDVLKNSAIDGNELCVIIDDAYFGLIYEDDVFQESLFSLLADLDENVLAIKVDGATKEYYVWGLRVGFLTFGSKGISEAACNALESKTAGVLRGCISNASHLSQSLIYYGLKSPTLTNQKNEKYKILKARFNSVREVLKNERFTEPSAPFKALPYNSGYFMCIELAPWLDTEKVRQILLSKYNTGVIAINNLLRIAYSSVKENCVEELFENIYNACQDVQRTLL
jgi:aspartate/methionine/tyrosine aminotransferase